MRTFETNDCKFATMPAQNKHAGIFYAALLIFTVAPAIHAQSPPAASSDTWTIHANAVDPAHYFGVTVANGMIGLVSSADPFRAKDVVLNGAFDLYGRGRVSNILKTFNFVNLNLDIDGTRIDNFAQTTGLQQVL